MCLTLRYFKLELYPKKAIQKADLPPFLTTWLDRSSPDCMFSTVQLKTWPTPHLQACPWYIESHFGVTPPEERALFLSLKDVAVVEPEFDEFAGMDLEARAKAARKREAADRKKVEKWNDAEKKAQENKRKRAAAQAEKEQERAKKKASKKNGDAATAEPASSAGGHVETSSGFSLTQQQLLHGLTPSAQKVDPVPNVDECILNVSLDGLTDNDKAMDSVVAFLTMVCTQHSLYCFMLRFASSAVLCGMLFEFYLLQFQ